MDEESKKAAQKLFDSKQYNTVIVKGEEKPEQKQGLTSGLVDLLTNDSNKDLKHEVLKVLKEKDGSTLLTEAILKTSDKNKKQKLIAACWESCADCSKHLTFFIDIAVHAEYELCLEAMTVIEENMPGPFNAEELKMSKEKLMKWMGSAKSDDPKIFFLQNILNTVTGFE